MTMLLAKGTFIVGYIVHCGTLSTMSIFSVLWKIPFTQEFIKNIIWKDELKTRCGHYFTGDSYQGLSLGFCISSSLLACVCACFPLEPGPYATHMKGFYSYVFTLAGSFICEGI